MFFSRPNWIKSEMDRKVLSAGSLDQILEEKNTSLKPYVQVVGAKVLSENRSRIVIWDGTSICQHCITGTEAHTEGAFEKYSVIRLDEYSLSGLPKKDNIQIILVNKITLMAKGLFCRFHAIFPSLI